jgi:polyisoprenoid-binding protein YceI
MKTPIATFLFSATIVFHQAQGQEKWVPVVKDESSIHYRLTHPMHEVNAVSNEVNGRIEIDPAEKKIEAVTADVDVMTFDSGNSNRDSHAMEVVDALTYPAVNFAGTSVIQQGDSVFVRGTLTFHGITNDVTIAGKDTWTGSSVTVDGRFSISLTAFKIERPSLLFIPVNDELKFTIHALYRF